MYLINKVKKYSKYTILTSSIIILSACGGSSGSSATNSSGGTVSNSTLKIVSPSNYVYDNKVYSDGIHFAIYNNGDSTVSNIKYTFRVNTVNSNINIPDNCNSIPAKSLCNLVIPVAPGSDGAVFSLNASYSDGVVNNSSKLLATNNAVSNMTSLIPLDNNTNSGVDGIMLYAHDTVIDADGDDTNDTDVMVTAIVNPFNESQIVAIDLVDQNGDKLKTERLSVNDGGVITPGSDLTFMLALPGGTISQDVYVQTTDINNVVSRSSTAINIKVISKNSDIGIISQAPNLSKLTSAKSSQVIYVSNIGVGQISNLLITAKDANLKIANDNCSGKTLNPTEYCNYTVSFDPSIVIASKGEVSASYTNSTGQVSNSIYVMYSGAAVNTSVLVSPLGEFSTNIANPSQSQIMTVVNNGNVALTPIKPTIPNQFFSILGSAKDDCFSGSILKPGKSCNITLNYNSGDTASMSGFLNLNLQFSYSTGSADLLYSYNQPMNYNTSTIAVIGSIISSIDFNNIINDGSDESSILVHLTNTGTGEANDLSFAITGNNPDNIYTYTTSNIDNPCSDNLSAGQSCNVLVNFGATMQSASESSLLSYFKVYYRPDANNSIINYQLPIIGNVIESHSANIKLTNTTSTFDYGDGSISSPYLVKQDAESPSVVYTFTNLSKSGRASNLTFSLVNVNWQISGGTCLAKGYLESNNDNCTLVLTTDTSSIGNKDITINDLTISWQDDKSVSQLVTNSIYAQVVPLANIIATVSGDGYESASDGSYLVKPQTTYSLDLAINNNFGNNLTVTPVIQSLSGNAIISPSSCNFSSTNKTCKLNIITANNDLGAGDFTLSYKVSLTQFANPIASMLFHTWDGSLPNQIGNLVVGMTSNNNYLYMGYNNGTNDNLRKCSVLSNGNIYSCVDAAINKTFDFAFLVKFIGQKAYVGDSAPGAWGGTQFGSLSVCDVNANSGILSNCVSDSNLRNEIGNSSSLHGITTYTPRSGNSVLYISSFYNLFACILGVDGSFNYKNCTPQLATNTNVGDLYVKDNSIYFGTEIGTSSYLNRCDINQDTGSISNCNDITPTLLYNNASIGFMQDTFANTMLDVGNYFYAVQWYARKDIYDRNVAICPSSSSISQSSTCHIQYTSYQGYGSLTYLNGYLYFGGEKFQIDTDGSLINPSLVVAN